MVATKIFSSFWFHVVNVFAQNFLDEDFIQRNQEDILFSYKYSVPDWIGQSKKLLSLCADKTIY